MKRFAAFATAFVFLVGCGGIARETRVERGPLLRHFSREQTVGLAGAQLRVEPGWPEAKFFFTREKQCRHEEVDEYAETRTTVRRAPGGGPALAAGVSQILAGLGLFLARGLFSDVPDTTRIDEGGRYPATARTQATIWSYVVMALGLPATVVGAVQLGQQGESSERMTAEVVTQARESVCETVPFSGALVVAAKGKPPVELNVTNGTIVAPVTSWVDVPLERWTLGGEAVHVVPTERAKLDALRACMRVIPAPAPETVVALAEAGRQLLAQAVDACVAAVPSAPVDETRQRLSGEPPSGSLTPAASFAEALAQFAPEITMTDASRLFDAETLRGKRIHVRSAVVQRHDSGHFLTQVGVQPVWLLTKPSAERTAIAPGQRVEVLATGAGLYASQGVSAPLLEVHRARLAP
ncbi:MAG: hypothetical protein ACKVPX_13950 [Myxococcaceae bacterium]